MKLPAAKDYPKDICVGEESYEIRIVSRIPGQPANTIGLCDPGEHIIWLKRRQSKAQLFRTAVHEVLHAIEAEMGIDIKHEQIYLLERGLVDTILMNW